MAEELFRFLNVRSPQVAGKRETAQYILHYSGSGDHDEDALDAPSFPPLVDELEEALGGPNGSAAAAQRRAAAHVDAHRDLVGGPERQTPVEVRAAAESLAEVHVRLVELVEGGTWNAGELEPEVLRQRIEEEVLGMPIEEFLASDVFEAANTSLWNLYYASVAANAADPTGHGSRSLDGRFSAARQDRSLIERVLGMVQASFALQRWPSDSEGLHESLGLPHVLNASPPWPRDLLPLLCGRFDRLAEDELPAEEPSELAGEAEDQRRLAQQIDLLREVRDEIRRVTHLVIGAWRSSHWSGRDLGPLELTPDHYERMDEDRRFSYFEALAIAGIELGSRSIPDVIDDLNNEIASLLGRLFTPRAGAHEPLSSLPMGDSLGIGTSRVDGERSRREVLGLGENPTVPTTSGEARVLGIGDLIRVEETLLRYVPSEVAHIENVLASERRERTHRRLNRSEQFVEVEEVTEEEEERDLESTERFEMQQEVETTIEQDQKVSAGVDVTAKYGSVKINATSDFARNTSRRNANKMARDYSREVTERSLKRVRMKVRERRTRRITEEVEETNLHAFENTSPGAEHVTGIYRWANKVIEAQLVNYGQRLMLEFVVPEPAAFLRALENGMAAADGVHAPQAPAFSPTDLDETNYWIPAKAYGAQGVSPPPPEWKTQTLAMSSGARQVASDAGESGEAPPQPVATQSIEELTLPEGYRARIGAINGHVDYAPQVLDQFIRSDELDRSSFKGHTDDWGDLELLASAGLRPYLAISAGRRTIQASAHLWLINKKFSITDQGALDLRSRVGDVSEYSWPPAPGVGATDGGTDLLSTSFVMDGEEGVIPVSTVESFLDGFGLNVEVVCERTPEKFARWQQETFDAIWAAYEKLRSEYEDRRSAKQIEAGVGIGGRNPARKREIVEDELKKSCITLMTNQWFDSFDAIRSAVPPHGYPEINPLEAKAEGEYISFFEQAFEWDQMTYTFYPYFWGRKDHWPQVASQEDIDSDYARFLRAGAARVVVPVRPTLDEAVAYYFVCGDVWKGGDPPNLEDEMYTSIVTELKEAKNAPRDGDPVEEPWTHVVPTSLIWLQRDIEKHPEAALPDFT